ncbi:3-deoxy-manno-octulosonate cytidylyltransferase [Telmatospirillum sp.]|uniref:3-deoxy-manno-octulosonate cytidylyltransferase n=1 Tax=Telmatospirillum sp. TaxID=2079197 RepID=UPI002849B9AC|nr:3-deoxy-manno-octulosonate cytidylyltransferase [Telmatospirillum sp.]MDR3439692.1 3-deoxy-manno-octulosonate cytidylyltransferase [Telmatospirillum sp.]
MDVAIVIPARYNSRRLPGKPMVSVAGRSLLHRVVAIAQAVRGVGDVFVTTDDQRVAQHAAEAGVSVLMTSPECATGTDRVHAALSQMSKRPDAVINLQGDAVLTPPWVVQGLVDAFHADPSVGMVTAAVHCSWRQVDEIEDLKRQSPTSGTLVTMDKFGRALYFSKAVIPFLRKREGEMPPVHRHIGIYGYSADVLDELATLPQSPLERAEQLEQLRALENGIPIKVVVVDYRGRTHGSIDSPEDIPFVEAVIAREGELVAG